MTERFVTSLRKKQENTSLLGWSIISDKDIDGKMLNHQRRKTGNSIFIIGRGFFVLSHYDFFGYEGLVIIIYFFLFPLPFFTLCQDAHTIVDFWEKMVGHIDAPVVKPIYQKTISIETNQNLHSISLIPAKSAERTVMTTNPYYTNQILMQDYKF